MYLVEPMGAESWVTVELGAGPGEGARVMARGPAELNAAPGAPAWIRVDRTRLHRFDQTSGRRL